MCLIAVAERLGSSSSRNDFLATARGKLSTSICGGSQLASGRSRSRTTRCHAGQRTPPERYFGFLGNCHRGRKLALCRELLGMVPAAAATDPPANYRDRFEALTGQSLRECP